MNPHCSHGRTLPELVLLLLAVSTLASLAQSGVPRPDHVVIVVEENHAFGDIINPSGPRYINTLARQGALFVSSYAITHPSEPNYIALFSGSTHGVTGDICTGAYGSPNLASELLRTGLTFGGYSESLPYAGFTGCDDGEYRRKHNPWVDFTNVPSHLNLPLTSFPTDFPHLPALSFVVPNRVNDMHSGSVAQGDDWLRAHLDAYVQWAQAHNSLLIVTWDEDDRSADNHIPTIFVGPMVRPGKYGERIDHYSVLRTLLEMYRLTPMDQATNADPITSCWVPGTAPSAVTLDLASPVDGDVFLAGSNVVFTAAAETSSGAVSKVQFFDGLRKIGEATQAPFQFAWSTATPGAHCLLAKATDTAGHTKTSVSVQVRVLPPDATPPTTAILTPAANARTTNPVVTLRAIGRDNVGVAAMAYRIGDGPFLQVEGASDLSIPLPLAPGTNWIRVKSIDFYGHESAPAAVGVFYVSTSPLTIFIHGNGTVLPDLAGQMLEVGRSYTLTARPDARNLFAGWDGDATNASGRLTFLMQSNLSLIVSFITNPFVALRGSYAGLFYERAEARHETAGFLALNLTEQGRFSAQILSAGRRLAFSGGFDWQRHATRVVNRPGANALTVEMFLDPAGGGPQLAGRVSTLEWEATLLADHAVFDGRTRRAPFATNYTLALRGDPGSASRPAGDGFGIAGVDAGGSVTFAGTLAEGTRVTQKTTVSTNGFWPFYAPLYGGKGSVLGWLTIADRRTSDLNGRVRWTKPPSTAARYYPAGFAVDADVEGSVYTRPGAGRALDLTNSLVSFTAGNLLDAFTNSVTLGPNNKVANASSNRLVLTILRPQGLFNGTVTPPEGGHSLPFKGVLLQKQNSGAGFFLGTSQSGGVSWRAGATP